MKFKIILLICFLFTIVGNAQVSKKVTIKTPGTLSTFFTDEELKAITNLKVKGFIDASDFKTIRRMKYLTTLNIKDVIINSYTEILNLAGFVYDSVYTQEAIPKDACYYMDNLQNVILPSSITSIGNSAFSNDTSLISISIPSSVIKIGNAAFNTCKKLKSIDLPPNLISIGLVSFTCTGLASIYIPPSVTNIEDYAFNVFRGLINVDSNNPTYSSINGMLYNKSQTILLQSSTSIKGDFIVPASVTKIGIGAFWGCGSLTSITFPSTVSEIGNNAFVNCNKINTFYLKSTNPPKVNNSFYAFQRSKSILYVPKGTKSAYQVAYGWKDFKNIVEE